MPKEKHIDAQLVSNYQSGDQKALTVLVKRWHKEFCTIAFWIVKDVDIAKDVAQESWKTIITKINGLRDTHSFAYWATRVVRTKAIDELRKQARLNKHLPVLSNEVERNEEPYVDEKVKRKLYSAIVNLPEHQQHVIRLFYVEDYSLNEIADILDIKPGTVKSRLFHAREKLKTILKHRYYEN